MFQMLKLDKIGKWSWVAEMYVSFSFQPKLHMLECVAGAYCRTRCPQCKQATWRWWQIGQHKSTNSQPYTSQFLTSSVPWHCLGLCTHVTQLQQTPSRPKPSLVWQERQFEIGELSSWTPLWRALSLHLTHPQWWDVNNTLLPW